MWATSAIFKKTAHSQKLHLGRNFALSGHPGTHVLAVRVAREVMKTFPRANPTIVSYNASVVKVNNHK
jgi:hypothetical protein